jgi:hypothetical protein
MDLDGFSFNYSKIRMFLLKMFHLDDVVRGPSQPPVQLACTLDGADISKQDLRIWQLLEDLL